MGQKKGTKPGNEGRKAWPLLPALPIPPIMRPTLLAHSARSAVSQDTNPSAGAYLWQKGRPSPSMQPIIALQKKKAGAPNKRIPAPAMLQWIS